MDFDSKAAAMGSIFLSGSLTYLAHGMLLGFESFHGHVPDCFDKAFGLVIAAIWFSGISGMVGIRLTTKKDERTRIQHRAKLAYDFLVGLFVFGIFVELLEEILGGPNIGLTIASDLVSPLALLVVTFSIAFFGTIACWRVRHYWWFAAAAFVFAISAAISCWIMASILLDA